jgi:hypothetical protein
MFRLFSHIPTVVPPISTRPIKEQEASFVLVAGNTGPVSKLCHLIFLARSIGLSRPIGRLALHPSVGPDGMIPAFGGLFFVSVMMFLGPRY